VLNRELAQARTAVDVASRRRWGRRDRPGIEQARARLEAARSALPQAVDLVARSRQTVAEERQALADWSAAMRASADQRADLTSAVADIAGALDITRPERVAAATRDPSSKLWRTLGPPPTTRGGLAAWCGIAQRVVAWRDQLPDTRPLGHRAPSADDFADLRVRLHLHPAHRRDGLAALVERNPTIIAYASQLDPSPPRPPIEDRAAWQPAVDAADRALAVEQARSMERGLGVEL
jgi:hypothetical protein